MDAFRDRRLIVFMPGPQHPLRYRDYRLFWTARLCSALAQNGMVVIIGWQVFDIARRTMTLREASLQLGIVGLLQFIPLFALTLVTGWVADFVDRRLIARLCLALQLFCAALLAWFSASHVTTLLPFFLMAMLLGVGRAFSNPTMNALAPQLVPTDVLPRAIAINALANRSGAILGPTIAGYLYALAPELPYAVSAALFGTAMIMIVAIRPIARLTQDRSRHPVRQMLEGLGYVWGNRLVLGAISLDLFAVLLGGATALLPVFASEMLHTGPEGLGYLRSATSIGSITAALVFSHRPLRTHAGLKMLSAVAIFGASTIAFGLSRWLPLSLAALALLGAADMFSVYVRQSLIQLSTPNEMRGRVGAVSSLFISASNELGEAESGFLAAAVGPVAAVVIGGVGGVAVAIIWAQLFPALRQVQNFTDGKIDRR